ncbi:hypothetical protein SOPEG_1630 [Candidatus Sodalis pierantonius str. SOPE]|uniref:Uncharacterized protein n=2 Tax=Sodalis TaxID=84565 RepID=W0HIZ9_9GAMM|nr:hypothetical protein SOPEG_1630 [Candidatus Sodalis pierantonius str. SOPE]
MTDDELRALFKIPDAITTDEFVRRTGKSEQSVRKWIERRFLPLATEKEVFGEKGSSRRLLILWNEWLEMISDVTSQLPPVRCDWKRAWHKRAKKLREDLGVPYRLGGEDKAA